MNGQEENLAPVPHPRSIEVPGTVPAIIDQGLLSERMLEIAEQQLERREKLKLIALRATKPADWIDFEGLPYLGKTGCEKLMGTFGIKATIKVTQEIVAGRVTFVCDIVANLNGREIHEQGVSDIQDKFFAYAHGKPKPPNEVDIPSIRLKAVTKAYNRATKALLGIGGITWEDINGKVRQEATAGVKFKKGEGGRSPLKQRAGELLWHICGEDRDEYRQILLELTSWKTKDGKEIAGKASIDELSDKQTEILLKKLEGMVPPQQTQEAQTGTSGAPPATQSEAAKTPLTQP